MFCHPRQTMLPGIGHANKTNNCEVKRLVLDLSGLSLRFFVLCFAKVSKHKCFKQKQMRQTKASLLKQPKHRGLLDRPTLKLQNESCTMEQYVRRS